MTAPELERRSCPCTHIVSLAEKTSGQFQVVTQEILHTKATIEERMEVLVTNSENLQLGVKECLESMQKSTVLFNEGTYKFQRIDSELASIRNEAAASKLSAKEHSIDKIRNRQVEEAHYRKDIDARFKIIERVLLLVSMVFVLSHGHTVVSFFEGLYGR